MSEAQPSELRPGTMVGGYRIEHVLGAGGVGASGERPTATGSRDGWLEKCERFDRNELASSDPMVLEKVLVLRDSFLFASLSGEERYPSPRSRTFRSHS